MAKLPEECDFDSMPIVYNAQKGKHEFAFFADRDPRFLHKLARLLHNQKFEKGDTIIQEGDIGYNMYFVHSGKVEVLVGPDQTRVAIMERGSYFGEMALYGMRKRTATIRALEKTTCLVVKRRVFEFLLRRFPEERVFFENLSRKRKQAILRKNTAKKEAEKEGKVIDRADEFAETFQGPMDEKQAEIAGVRKLPLLKTSTPEPGEVEADLQTFEHPLESPRKSERRQNKKKSSRPVMSETFRNWSNKVESPQEGESPRAGTLLPSVGNFSSAEAGTMVPFGRYGQKKYAGVLGLEKELRRQVGQYGHRHRHSHTVDY